MPLDRLAIPNAAAQSRNHQEIHQSKHDEGREKSMLNKSIGNTANHQTGKSKIQLHKIEAFSL
jgi:hypothetical protein